ncbi:MAG: acetoacetate decarboxylase family protein [Myxococcales bacterium]|nr:acetoacetate decarboxylase family protein [Myxococcales bacterium]
MSSEFFRSVKQWDFEWEGRKAKLPVFYPDNTSLTAIFTAATAKVRALLPRADMYPIELLPGKCLAAFTAFEYRQSDIDPYNEFSIAFMVTLGKPQVPGLTAGWQLLQRRFSVYVWQLPVTTEIARYGGVELYGYPKFLADIVFTRGADTLTCDLSEQGKRILTLQGKVQPVAPGKVSRFVTYSVKDNIPLVANVLTNPLEFAQSRDPEAAQLTLGDHAIADTLRTLELSPKPLLTQYCPKTEAILFAGRNLQDC